MAMKNRYAKNSKISEAKIREVIRLFSLNLDATQIAVLTGLNRNTVNRFLKALRERIAEYCESQSPCPERSKWMNPSSGPDGSKENGVEELLERPLFLAFSNGTEKSIPRSFRTAPKTLFKALFGERRALESVIYSDGWRGYEGQSRRRVSEIPSGGS